MIEHPLARRFYHLSFVVMLGVIALMPVLFLSSAVSTFGSVKFSLMAVGVLLAVALWAVSQFIEGALYTPKSRVLLVLGLFALFSFLSALFSPNLSVSLSGKFFSLDATFSITLFVLTAFLVSIFASDRRRLATMFLALITSFLAALVLQMILFFSRGTPPILANFSHVATSGTLVGSWVDFAFFTTVVVVLSLLIIEVLRPSKLFRAMALGTLGLSLVVLALLNFQTAWLFAVVSALVVFTYTLSVERSILAHREDTPSSHLRFPVASFATLIVGVFFLLAGKALALPLARVSQFSFADIRPNLVATLEIARPVLGADPLFGGGPARFPELWEQFRGVAVNQTSLWGALFDQGFSTLSTLFITNGVLTGAALVVALVLAVILGARLFTARYPDRFARFIGITSFVLVLIFSILLFLTAPSVVLIFNLFVLVGFLVGTATLVGAIPGNSFRYLHDPRSSFFSILGLALVSIATLAGMYVAVFKFAGSVLYRRAIASQTTEEALPLLARAVQYSERDLYLRTMSSLYGSQFAQVFATPEENQSRAQVLFTNTERLAQRAVALDPTNGLNWFSLGTAYRLAFSEKTPEALGEAEKAFKQSIARGPNNPSYHLALADLYASAGKLEEAQAGLARTLELKPDYFDAYLLKARLATLSGKENPRTVFQTYTERFPGRSAGFYALGVVDFNQKSYTQALSAFERARALEPSNINAHLRYISTLKILGRTDEMRQALEALSRLFPRLGGIQEEIDRLNAEEKTPPPEAIIEEDTLRR